MNKYTKRSIIRLSIILTVLLILFSAFYFFLIDTTIKNEASKIAYTHHLEDSNNLDQIFTTFYQSYQTDDLNWTSKSYTNELNSGVNLELYTITTLSNLFTDEISQELVFVVKKLGENEVMYKNFDQMLIDRGMILDDELIILDKFGKILYYQDALLIGTNFFTSNLYPNQMFSQLDSQMGTKDQGYLNFQENNHNQIISFYKLENHMSFITVSEESYYLISFYPIIWGYLSLSLFTLLAYTIFSIVTIKRNYDEDLAFSKLSKNQPNDLLILEVGGLGQIRLGNPTFNKLFPNANDLKIITELTNDKIDIKAVLKLQKAFFMNIKINNTEINYRFVIIKKLRSYILIGENTLESSGMDGKYRAMALLNYETNLPNKLAFLEDHKNLDKQTKFSVISFSVEDYESIIKTIGRDYAKKFTDSLVSLFKENITHMNMSLYHMDFNHFAILERNVTNFDMVSSWVKRLLDKLNGSVLMSDLPVTIKLKSGIVNSQNKVTTMSGDELYEVMSITLDRALNATVYNQVIYSERLSEQVTKNQQMELDIKKGILKNEFVMYMQPQFDISDDTVVGFELLLRWNNEKYIKESPASYIRLAEQSNLILELGRVINEHVFRIASSFSKYNVDFSFNISPRQLIQPGFIQELVELKNKYQVDTSKISIELTETILVMQLDVIIEKFKALKALGFKIQLDDFGTGYSSLSYLKTLPVDVIKIDKKFVDDIETSFTSRQILKTLTNLGKNLKLTVIFEGVETEKQVDIIKKDGGTVIQGFIISRAIPEADATIFIKERKTKPHD